MVRLNTLLQGPVALLLALLVIAGCSSNSQQLQVISGMTMGTTYTVKWFADSASNKALIQAEITQTLAAVNQSMSTYINDSELSQFNQLPADSDIQASEGLFQVLTLADQISRQTHGAFDVTVGPLVNLWGFGPNGRIEHTPSPQTINRMLADIGFTHLQLDAATRRVQKKKALYVDLSAIAKGYGVDQVAQVLVKHGISAYLVEIGGELRAAGHKADGRDWRIAVETPAAGKREVQRIVSVSDTGIATSGDYRNYFEEQGVRYSHTIDPATGQPIQHKLASVTVLRPDCAEADALATAFTVMGEQKAYEFAMEHQIEAFFIVKSADGFIEKMTPGFAKRLVE